MAKKQSLLEAARELPDHKVKTWINGVTPDQRAQLDELKRALPELLKTTSKASLWKLVVGHGIKVSHTSFLSWLLKCEADNE